MRLAEVLTQKGVVAAEVITDALYIQDKEGEPFVDILVEAGHIAEWDLARVVVENFQLPFILAGNYDISQETRARIEDIDFFQHMLVPMGLFGDILTVSMPVLVTADVLMGLQKKYDVEIFPYVGLISENKKVLSDEFADFKAWQKSAAEERERRAAAAKRAANAPGAGEWADLFDEADQAVQSSIGRRPRR